MQNEHFVFKKGRIIMLIEPLTEESIIVDNYIIQFDNVFKEVIKLDKEGAINE